MLDQDATFQIDELNVFTVRAGKNLFGVCNAAENGFVACYKPADMRHFDFVWVREDGQDFADVKVRFGIHGVDLGVIVDMIWVAVDLDAVVENFAVFRANFVFGV